MGSSTVPLLAHALELAQIDIMADGIGEVRSASTE